MADQSESKQDPRRQELGAFVRRCRERLTPAEIGVSGHGRRRTPGLRREELSQVAGVGLTWLTWLEQGREIAASPDALMALARTMRMNDDEQSYLFALAGVRIPKTIVEVDNVPERIHAIVDAIHMPACIINYRLEVPHLNALGRRFFLYDNGEDQNCARRVFLDTRYRALFEDINALEKLAVGILRLAWSRHSDDVILESLIAELSEKNNSFKRLWHERYVMHPVEQHVVGFRHPDYGDVPYEAQTLLLNENADLSVYIAVPVERDYVFIDLSLSSQVS